MAVVVAFLFTGPRGGEPFPVQVSFIILALTGFSLVVLGKRFPWFGLFMIMLIGGLLSGLTSRGRRRGGGHQRVVSPG
jgi:hypothetical protein